MKPTCTSATPALVVRSRDGYRSFNHSFAHPDATVTVENNEEAYLKADDIVFVKRPYPTFVQMRCPHCAEYFGYNRSLFLASEIPPSFWREGEWEANERVHKGDYTL